MMGHIDSLAKIPTVSIYGIRFSKLNMQDTVACLGNVIESGHSIQLITANPIMVMEALENPKFMSVMKQADLIIPDGTGIVWAANYVGDPVAERVTGFDLLHEPDEGRRGAPLEGISPRLGA